MVSVLPAHEYGESSANNNNITFKWRAHCVNGMRFVIVSYTGPHPYYDNDSAVMSRSYTSVAPARGRVESAIRIDAWIAINI